MSRQRKKPGPAIDASARVAGDAADAWLGLASHHYENNEIEKGMLATAYAQALLTQRMISSLDCLYDIGAHIEDGIDSIDCDLQNLADGLLGAATWAPTPPPDHSILRSEEEPGPNHEGQDVLALSRREDEFIVITTQAGEVITVRIGEIGDRKVLLAIDAPREVRIRRGEKCPPDPPAAA